MNPMLLVCINFVPSKIIFQANVLNDAQGQGCKICPFSDADNAHTPHTHATRDALKQRLKESQYQMRTVGTCSAQWALFEKTLSLYRSYHVNGCMGPASPTETVTTDLHSNHEDDEEHTWRAQLQQIRRGHSTKPSCDGKLLFDYDPAGKAFVQ